MRRNHVMCWRCPKCLIVIVLVDVDLPYCTSKVEHIVAFTAIFSNICTAHAQKRLLMNFRCKFWDRRSIRRPQFPVRVQNFGDLTMFSVDFCISCSANAHPPITVRWHTSQSTVATHSSQTMASRRPNIRWTSSSHHWIRQLRLHFHHNRTDQINLSQWKCAS